MSLTPEQRIQRILKHENNRALVQVYLRLIEIIPVVPGHYIAVFPTTDCIDPKSIMTYIVSAYLLGKKYRQNGEYLHTLVKYIDDPDMHFDEVKKSGEMIRYLTSASSEVLGITSLVVSSPQVPSYYYLRESVKNLVSKGLLRGAETFEEFADIVLKQIKYRHQYPTLGYSSFEQAEEELPKIIKKFAEWEKKQKK